MTLVTPSLALANDGEPFDGEGEGGSHERSDGSLLERVNITIADPTHVVETGDVWSVGPHLLICVEVLTEWETWVPYLDGEDCIFAPYPGAFVPLTLKAEEKRLVMVQPDKYIAGHILDRYSEIYGEGEVQKHDAEE